MDKEELYEKVIELMERVRELEKIIEDNLDDLDETNKRLADADAENAELKKALDNYKDQEITALGYADDERLLEVKAENKSLKEENDMLRRALPDYYKLMKSKPEDAPDSMRFPGELTDGKRPFLREFLDEHELTTRECGELCGISQSEAARLARGYRCENPTFDKVVHGLGLTAEQATEFRKSLTKKQHGYTR